MSDQGKLARVELIAAAARRLRDGQLVAFPTETVYGLGADAANPLALRRIFALKGRPADHPLIVHIGAVEQLERWARAIPDWAYLLAGHFWPGPLTLILPRAAGVPLEVTGGQDTIGLRIPRHPVARALLQAFGGGIAAPSANRFGRISPTCARHVEDAFGDQVGMILDGGDCQVGLESTIVSLVDGAPHLLRPGMIAAADIAALLGRDVPGVLPQTSPIRVPGSHLSHYAPVTPLQVCHTTELWSRAEGASRAGLRSAVMTFDRGAQAAGAPTGIDVIAMPGDSCAYARDLYAVMHRLDRGGYDRLFAEAPPATDEWLAITNRLTRAMHNN
ncbi:MAG: L-threonylcarbamoyladenylate synthase [Pelovirga sp.]